LLNPAALDGASNEDPYATQDVNSRYEIDQQVDYIAHSFHSRLVEATFPERLLYEVCYRCVYRSNMDESRQLAPIK